MSENVFLDFSLLQLAPFLYDSINLLLVRNGGLELFSGLGGFLFYGKDFFACFIENVDGDHDI